MSSTRNKSIADRLPVECADAAVERIRIATFLGRFEEAEVLKDYLRVGDVDSWEGYIPSLAVIRPEARHGFKQ